MTVNISASATKCYRGNVHLRVNWERCYINSDLKMGSAFN